MGNQCTAEDSREDEMRSEEKRGELFRWPGTKEAKALEGWRKGDREREGGRDLEARLTIVECISSTSRHHDR